MDGGFRDHSADPSVNDDSFFDESNPEQPATETAPRSVSACRRETDRRIELASCSSVVNKTVLPGRCESTLACSPGSNRQRLGAGPRHLGHDNGQ